MRVLKGVGLVLLVLLVLLLLLTAYHWVYGAGFADAFGMTAKDVRVAMRYPNRPSLVVAFISRPVYFDKMLDNLPTYIWLPMIGESSADELRAEW